MSETMTDGPQEDAYHTEFSIVINGELAVLPHREVSYTEVVAIAYPVPPSPETTYRVTFRNAMEPRHEGILVDGEIVEVKEAGTKFNVSATGKS